MPSPDRGLIGVVEDDAVMGGTLAHRLELEGYRVAWWQTGREAVEQIDQMRPDLVVCDIRLPDMNGEEIFLRALPRHAETPFLFVTAFGEIDQAVRMMKAGAIDYIAKPYVLSDLVQRLPGLLRSRTSLAGILGQSDSMHHVEILLRRVADIESSLLVTGESGVGKEVV